ncbi:NAD(P)H-dependent glycerol-3-phosphate dehydrogenase [Dethiosulfatarculus sandiegensis]|uniref:Glycerol-3-phosphate dehydrogenase [NAD(P)+] n=1 Tax=Dethiosulfatarculus sandiegensis TaxID=1429043 RepID=A0A0D2JYE1_9BACT|nr:NAD(P)H-dependent glycerol-3-phosphate dehydrogenase [Dethiosulfatarculus sandiegensis]KIX14550.1 glycerol-3-phosphate dehydrogenase [Dethiosulfatarculus sandiegensis]
MVKTSKMMSPNSPKNGLLKVCVLGAGSWGTALAAHLAKVGHHVTIWAYEAEVAESINQDHENTAFLPEIELPQNLKAKNDLGQGLIDADMVLMVMPSHVYRTVLKEAMPHLPKEAPLVSCAKGIEKGTGFTMCNLAKDLLPGEHHEQLCCLSGPSFAREVAKSVPTAVTVAAVDQAMAQRVQDAFASPWLRVYTSTDLVGIELGGAVKNPLAIAAGMCTGLNAGHNTLAALITRGLAEMTRLSLAMGGRLETLSGLAGLGDLVLTCTGELSRNRTVGVRLGKGESISQITSSMRMVAEGVHNTDTVLDLAQSLGVEMPIVDAVHRVIHSKITPAKALEELMTRDLKPEHY